MGCACGCSETEIKDVYGIRYEYCRKCGRTISLVEVDYETALRKVQDEVSKFPGGGVLTGDAFCLWTRG